MQFESVNFVLDSKVVTYAFHAHCVDVTKFGQVILACKSFFTLLISQTLRPSLKGDK